MDIYKPSGCILCILCTLVGTYFVVTSFKMFIKVISLIEEEICLINISNIKNIKRILKQSV